MPALLLAGAFHLGFAPTPAAMRRVDTEIVAMNRRQLALSLLSGIAWGLLAVGLSYGRSWGGLIAAPFIGATMRMVLRWWPRWPIAVRVVVALLGLYVAAALFGIGSGVYDALVHASPNRIPQAVVWEHLLGFLWGLTFGGYFVWMWPLAYLNYKLLARFDDAQLPVVS